MKFLHMYNAITATCSFVMLMLVSLIPGDTITRAYLFALTIYVLCTIATILTTLAIAVLTVKDEQ